MPPSAPRAQRNARANNSLSKTTGRPSGIKKRGTGGPVRTDRDGDLDMGAHTLANGPSRGGRQASKASDPPTGPRRSTRSAPAGGRAPKPTTRAADMVKKIIESGSGNMTSRITAGIRGSRPINAANTMTLKIGGLKDSKAANNEGGGLNDLLIFIERKASTAGKSGRAVRVKKVSQHIRNDGLGYLEGSTERRQLSNSLLCHS